MNNIRKTEELSHSNCEIKTTEIIIFNQKIHEMETLYIINLVDGIDPVFSLSLIRTEHPGI